MSTDLESAKKEPEEQSFWPAAVNPFNSEYTQKAGNFLNNGIEGIVDFTKSGLSFGERFTLGLYDKISKWSKKWFTHVFLLLVIVLYSVLGALSFQAIEGNSLILFMNLGFIIKLFTERGAKDRFSELREKQQKLFKDFHDLSKNKESDQVIVYETLNFVLISNPFPGQFINFH